MLEALRILSSPRSTVMRGGVVQRIASQDLVEGDRLIVQEGDRVACDATLFDVHAMRVDESLLTCESVPIDKAVEDEDSGLLHAGVKPESFANRPIEIQIVDTHESLEARINAGFAAADDQVNRTLLDRHGGSDLDRRRHADAQQRGNKTSSIGSRRASSSLPLELRFTRHQRCSMRWRSSRSSSRSSRMPGRLSITTLALRNCG